MNSTGSAASIVRISVFTTVALVFAFLVSAAQAQDDGAANWLRYPAISPDGSQIAFSFRGDIWIVPSTGGAARMLTTHEAYERSPVWSPDGKQIAFASDRNGNMDVFLIPAEGGAARRLTYHSANDEPTTFTPDGESVFFTSRRLDAPQAAIGSSAMGELYSVSVDGGRPRQVMTTSADNATFHPDGKQIVFHDYKGFEDPWRKHHRSSVTRDIWTYDLESGEYRKLTDFPGEDRNPVYASDGSSIFYLSEEGGTFNVWKMNADDPQQREQVTQHAVHPVRFLSRAGDDTLCYGFNGEIWIMPPGGEARKIDVTAPYDERVNRQVRDVARDGATEFSVSPNEEEVAFVVRGEVFVANIEFGTTRRITNTPQQERSVTWSDDSRTIYYAGERDGSWNLYSSSIARDDEPGFAYATIITEVPVLETDDETFQPVCSPDGKKLAFLKNRTELAVLDLETRQTSTVVPGSLNFSYTDGDIEFDWAPDSRWLTLTYHGHKSWVPEIGAVELATGRLINVTDSGYGEQSPRFTRDGSALLYLSDRYGERSHGSWGAETDVIALYLTQDAYDQAVLDKEQLALKKKREGKKDSDKKKKPDDESNAEKKGQQDSDASAEGDQSDEETGKETDKKSVKPMKFDTDELDHRRRRMTLHSTELGAFDVSPDGETLMYTAKVDDKWGLWLEKIRERSIHRVLELGGQQPGRVHFAKNGKSAFLMQGGGRLVKVDLSAALNGGNAKTRPIGYAADLTIHGPEERSYIFEHAWRQVLRKFYDPDLHGVDWVAMKQNYSRFLPTINNSYDFSELLSEMLGELNASHTGCRYRPAGSDGDQTAALGLLYDVAWDGVGLKIAEVLEQGPCDRADTKIAAGIIITHIDGVRLTAEVNPWKLLNRKADKPVRLTLHADQGDDWEEVVYPISFRTVGNLMYERWIASRRRLVEELSDGRLGYVHVRGMNDASFRRVYSEVLGKNNEKEALIVDTRFNGGGWLHEDLATFLSGKTYCYFAPRGHQPGDLGGEPINKWTRPVVVVQSESNYSDAHFFPWAFKTKGVGTLIGAPVPGTATAVWWERQIDSSLVFGIPQVGMVTLDGSYLENQQLEPDILVINDPPAMASGKDPQIEKSVEVLLQELDRAR